MRKPGQINTISILLSSGRGCIQKALNPRKIWLEVFDPCHQLKIFADGISVASSRQWLIIGWCKLFPFINFENGGCNRYLFISSLLHQWCWLIRDKQSPLSKILQLRLQMHRHLQQLVYCTELPSVDQLALSHPHSSQTFIPHKFHPSLKCSPPCPVFQQPQLFSLTDCCLIYPFQILFHSYLP